jgi:hypothetical protein
LYNGKDGVGEVRITLSKEKDKATRHRHDQKAANEAAGFKETPTGYTWHHHQDTGRMQLVREDVHSEFSHMGGQALNLK